MHELRIEIKGKSITRKFPEKFSEFTLRHLHILHKFLQTADTDHLAYIRLIRDFMGIPKKYARHLEGDQLAFTEVKENKLELFPHLAYFKSPYCNAKSLMKRVGIFTGPSDRLSNVSIEQIAFTSGFSAAYAESKSGRDLNRFFAALYRPFFLPFHRYLIPLNEILARLVPRKTKELAHLNFQGLMQYFPKQYPTCYQGGGEPDGTERYQWRGTIMQLAKANVFGSYYEAKNVKFPDAMLLFEMNGLEVKRIKKNMKKNKK